jgi:effector-binding domain-containing protein
MSIKSFFAFAILLGLVSCNSDDTVEKPAATVAKDSIVKARPEPAPTSGVRPPVINITDTVSIRQTIIYMKDSAADVTRVSKKLAEILGFKLDAVVKKNKLKVTGSPIAWYNSTKAPFFFEAGLPVDKKPTKLPSNIMVREITADSVVVAHFYGPYELLPQAYEALRDWVKDRKKKLKGKPYEVYVGDPVDELGNSRDPYKVQTDVIFPLK